MFKSLLTKLSKNRNPIKRAKLLHIEIDKQMQPILQNETVKKLSVCQKGCAACCHTQVSVTQDEADLLALRASEGVEINSILLEVQASTGNDSKNWYGLEFKHRKCVFLNNKNECMVYEDRPAVCRTNNVLISSKNCSTEDGLEKPIRLINSHKADMAIVAGYKASKTNGALPHMLLQSIKRLNMKNKELNSNQISETYETSLKESISNNLSM